MFDQSDLDVGVSLTIGDEEWREKRAAADRRQAEPKRAAFQSSQLRQFGLEIVSLGEQSDCSAVNNLPSRR